MRSRCLLANLCYCDAHPVTSSKTASISTSHRSFSFPVLRQELQQKKSKRRQPQTPSLSPCRSCIIPNHGLPRITCKATLLSCISETGPSALPTPWHFFGERSLRFRHVRSHKAQMRDCGIAILGVGTSFLLSSRLASWNGTASPAIIDLNTSQIIKRLRRTIRRSLTGVAFV